ncbi:hypothetical protein V9T40_004483 [Parthenolecanium corni]|uniref:Ultrabithorax n=1 Tax=Parthenolecanium corni TaxID=536013 RepID=A0AAN9TWN0_9HEMI
MNSYFEQTGFYGGHHHHQSAGAAAHHHHDQNSVAAAYRFPLGLGMSPYASSQHHHHSLHQSRGAPDSPYDASVAAAAACKLYANDGQQAQSGSAASGSYSATSGGSSKAECKETAHQNGYAAAVAAAAKDVWQASSGAAAVNSNPLIRPSACTPESRVSAYGNTSLGLVGGDPSTSPGASAASVRNSSVSSSLTGSWNTCSINSASSQSAATQLHQQSANHTFYPWMAIAGKPSS